MCGANFLNQTALDIELELINKLNLNLMTYQYSLNLNQLGSSFLILSQIDDVSLFFQFFRMAKKNFSLKIQVSGLKF